MYFSRWPNTITHKFTMYINIQTWLIIVGHVHQVWSTHIPLPIHDITLYHKTLWFLMIFLSFYTFSCLHPFLSIFYSFFFLYILCYSGRPANIPTSSRFSALFSHFCLYFEQSWYLVFSWILKRNSKVRFTHKYIQH